jgi:hypothetical protein
MAGKFVEFRRARRSTGLRDLVFAALFWNKLK